MAFSFLSYMEDRKFSLSHFFPLPLLPHLLRRMNYTPLFLLSHFALLSLSIPLLLCNFHTTCATVAFYSGTLVPGSPEFWCPCSRILDTLQRLPPPSASSTPPCSFGLLLGVVLWHASATLLSPTHLLEVPLPPSCFLSSCQDPRDNPGSPSEGMRLRRGELDRVPSMNCLAIYISTCGYAKTILREITVSISYHLSSPE